MSGQLLFTLLLAVLLSMALAVVLGRRLRAAIQRQMQGNAQPAPSQRAPPEPTTPEPTAPGGLDVMAQPARAEQLDTAVSRPVDPLAYPRAARRLVGWLLGISLLIALSLSAVQLLVVIGEGTFSVRRWLLVGLVGLWPVLPALGLLWRWTRWRVVAALIGWGLACLLLIAVNTQPGQGTSGLVWYVAGQILPPLLAVAVICMGHATRAFAPWVFLPVLLLCAASVFGLELLARAVQAEAGWLLPVLELVGAWGTLAAAVVLPWMLAWWPARALAQALARAHARHWVSDLLVLFTAVWSISLVFQWLLALGTIGLPALLLLLPLAWIPVGVLWLQRVAPNAAHAPVLLVLRVFQQDRAVQALFDEVVERWRLVGHTVLIAGTDLIERTVDPGLLMRFLQGRLAEVFICSAQDVPVRLARFDLAPDLDTRLRVNACYCQDATWKDALAALVARSDRVLMDLRQFHAGNAGCLHELRVLAAHPRAARIVVLTDQQTDRAAAQAAVDGAALDAHTARRFVWLQTEGLRGRRLRRLVMDALLAPA